MQPGLITALADPQSRERGGGLRFLQPALPLASSLFTLMWSQWQCSGKVWTEFFLEEPCISMAEMLVNIWCFRWVLSRACPKQSSFQKSQAWDKEMNWMVFAGLGKQMWGRGVEKKVLNSLPWPLRSARPGLGVRAACWRSEGSALSPGDVFSMATGAGWSQMLLPRSKPQGSNS